MTIDPVCKVELEEASAVAEVDYLGIRYYFCSERCKHEFDRHPEQYVPRAGHPGIA
jgi:YHS domain-containing protein